MTSATTEGNCTEESTECREIHEDNSSIIRTPEKSYHVTMQIVSISWVSNEADVIETFVRHHCAFLDRMIIVDRRSRDNTREILKQLQKEGLSLDVRYSDSVVHLQGEALTALLAELRIEAPDLVLPLDADEFLWKSGAEDIRSVLGSLPKDKASLVPWHTYIPMPEDDASEINVLQRIRSRKTVELPQWHKVIIPKALLQKNPKLEIGSHALIDGESGRNAEHSISNALFLGHFPVRTASQLAGKVFSGWLSHSANPKRVPGTAFQWKTLFDELKSGKEIDAESLKKLALDYGTRTQSEVSDGVTLDPLPANFDLKYEAKRLPPLQILAESAEILAEKVAELTPPQT